MDITASMEKMKEEFAELERQLADPGIVNDPDRLKSVGRRHARLSEVMALYAEYQQAASDAADAEAMLADTTDDDMAAFLRTEMEEATARAEELHSRLLLDLVPGDPMEDRNAIVEIRAGTGGDEAGLFAKDLFTMYLGLAERRGWKANVIDESQGELGGIKEATFQVEGDGAYGVLRLESGVHRVQRVPVTESQGRIHTSAATVAVLPEVEDVEVELNPSELRFEAFRAGGPGGQHMQKNETAVRVTHVPTGISVTCSDARSQHQNREKALRILRARLYDVARQEQADKLSQQRREQVRSGDRSEKIRTYNFPQDRITDHRVGMSVHDLPSRMIGEIDDLLDALRQWDRQRQLQEALGTTEEQAQA